MKLCNEDNHDWYEIGKCKDALGHHPCKYAPEGCNTCMTRFECYTKDSDTYRARISGIFYACKKCPAVKLEGEISQWKTQPVNYIVDIREKSIMGLDSSVVKKLLDLWEDEVSKV